MYLDGDNSPLIGKTIKKIALSKDQTILVFILSNGEHVVCEAVADCCSESWFADITGVNVLLQGLIKQIELMDLDLPQDERCRQESDSFYGIKIKTDKGDADIIFRNSSNGYYGGWLEVKEYIENHHNRDDFIEITKDYTA